MEKVIFLNADNEQRIIDACKENDPQAQKMLFDSHFNKMMAICYRYLKNEDEALSVLNESFLKVFDKIKQFKPEAKIEYWIKQIVVNTVLDYIRKNKLYKNNFISTDEFLYYGEPNEDFDETSEWWEKASSIPMHILLVEVSNLPPATRIVFNLYAIEGCSHVKIAAEINISEGTSKWHLSNARKILKDRIITLLNKGYNKNETRKTK